MVLVKFKFGDLNDVHHINTALTILKLAISSLPYIKLLSKDTIITVISNCLALVINVSWNHLVHKS